MATRRRGKRGSKSSCKAEDQPYESGTNAKMDGRWRGVGVLRCCCRRAVALLREEQRRRSCVDVEVQ